MAAADCPSLLTAVTIIVCVPTASAAVPVRRAPLVTALLSIVAVHDLMPGPPVASVHLKDAFGTVPNAYDALLDGAVIVSVGGPTTV